MVVSARLPQKKVKPVTTTAAKLYRQNLGMESGIWRHHYPSDARLGNSVDWERERFTMDEGLSMR